MWIIYAIFCTIFISTIIYFCWRKRREIALMSRLPGPSLFATIRIVSVVGFCDYNQIFKIIEDLFATYGSIVGTWYGPIPLVLLKDPKHIENYYKQDQTFKRVHEIFNDRVMVPVFRGGILVLEGEEWRKRRKILNNEFRTSIIKNYVENFDHNSNILVNRMKERANGFFETLETLFTQCTIDIITENVFHYDLDVQKRNKIRIVENLEGSVEMFSRIMLRPWLFSDVMFKISEASRRQASIVSYLHSEINAGIDARIDGSAPITHLGNRENSVEQNIDLFETLRSANVSRDHIIGEVASIIGAGGETSSIACCFALALLSEHQDIQERVMEEQRNIFSNDMLGPVTIDNLTHMTYLEQVIKETLRLFPTLPYIYKTTVEEVEIDEGKILPEGSTLIISAYAVHRDENNYPNPDQFDPDRFTPENCAGRNPFAYLPFGHGRRMCVGHKFAMMEMKTILSNVLRRYHFLEIEGGVKGVEESLQTALVLKPLNEFKFRFVSRKTEISVQNLN